MTNSVNNMTRGNSHRIEAMSCKTQREVLPTDHHRRWHPSVREQLITTSANHSFPAVIPAVVLRDGKAEAPQD